MHNIAKVIPKSIAVSKGETYKYFKRACEQLSIELLAVEKLKFSPSIKEDLNQSLTGQINYARSGGIDYVALIEGINRLY